MKLAEVPQSLSSKMSVASSHNKGKAYNQHKAKQVTTTSTNNAANTKDYQDQIQELQKRVEQLKQRQQATAKNMRTAKFNQHTLPAKEQFNHSVTNATPEQSKQMLNSVTPSRSSYAMNQLNENTPKP